MILDEATANIDTETELLIQDSLEKMRTVGTMLIVAHRLSTIQHADNIIVLSHGKILEQGTRSCWPVMGGTISCTPCNTTKNSSVPDFIFHNSSAPCSNAKLPGAHFILGSTAQFPPDGLSTAPAAAAPRSPYRHLELCGIAFVILLFCPLRRLFWAVHPLPVSGLPAQKNAG